jgi:hypothetical protein
MTADSILFLGSYKSLFSESLVKEFVYNKK